MLTETNTSLFQRNPKTAFKERSIEKIKNGMLLDRIIKFCHGQLELTGKQVDTHLKLINKVLPDLQAVQHNVDVNHNVVDIHTLNARLSALGHDPQSVFAAISNNQPIDAVYKHVDNDVDNQGKTLVDNSVDSEGGTPDSHGDD